MLVLAKEIDAGNALNGRNGPTAMENGAVGAVYGVSMKGAGAKMLQITATSTHTMARKPKRAGSRSGRERPRSGRLAAAQTYSLAVAAQRSLPPTLASFFAG
jgi:hypothetical protein